MWVKNYTFHTLICMTYRNIDISKARFFDTSIFWYIETIYQGKLDISIHRNYRYTSMIYRKNRCVYMMYRKVAISKLDIMVEDTSKLSTCTIYQNIDILIYRTGTYIHDMSKARYSDISKLSIRYPIPNTISSVVGWPMHQCTCNSCVVRSLTLWRQKRGWTPRSVPARAPWRTGDLESDRSEAGKAKEETRSNETTKRRETHEKHSTHTTHIKNKTKSVCVGCIWKGLMNLLTLAQPALTHLTVGQNG